MRNNKLIWSFVFLMVLCSGSAISLTCPSTLGCDNCPWDDCDDCYACPAPEMCVVCGFAGPGGCMETGPDCNVTACFLPGTKVLVLIDEEDLLPGDEIVDVEKELNWYSLIWDKVRRFMYG